MNASTAKAALPILFAAGVALQAGLAAPAALAQATPPVSEAPRPPQLLPLAQPPILQVPPASPLGPPLSGELPPPATPEGLLPPPPPISKAVEVETLEALTADTGGPLKPGKGGLAADAWAGTGRPVAEALLSPDRLPAPKSGAMRAALTRFLLSDVRPPAGEPGPRGLAAQRLAILALHGNAEGATELGRAMPVALDDEAAATALLTAQLLSAEADAACAGAETALLRFPSVAAQKLLIICQVRAGQMPAATLGLDLLREQKEGDETFLLLAESAVLGRTGAVKGMAQTTALHLAMIQAAKRAPAPETKPSDPLTASALARADGPIALRLAAAEAAANWGLMKPGDLAAIYRSMPVPEAEMKDPLKAAEKRSGSAARSVLVQALGSTDSTAVKAELLRAAAQAADIPLLSGGYGEMLLQEVWQLPPAAGYAFVAPTAAKLALLQGRQDVARPWVELSRGEGEAFDALWPLALLHGMVRPDSAEATGWAARIAPADATPERVARVAAVALLLDAGGTPLPPPVRDGLLARGLAQPVAAGKDGLAMARLTGLGTARNAAEAVLLAARMFPADGVTQTTAATLIPAVAALERAGLQTEARRLAGEAVAALLAP